MKDRYFTPLLSLLSLISIIFFLTSCGSGGSSGSAALSSTTLAQNAIVTVGVNSNNFSGKSKKISGSANYIELYVTQWQAGDLNVLSVINQVTDTLPVNNPTATITLYPTYTRICAAQYSSSPSSSSTPIEASCSFGVFNPGSNTVTLTMLAGKWTLSPVYDSIQSVTLSYPSIFTATTGSLSYGVYDGNGKSGNSAPGQAPGQGVNNWGSYYQIQYTNSSGNIVTGLTTSFAAATTSFNYGDSGPSFTAFSETNPAPGSETDTFIGGVGKGVDSDGWLRETRNIILYPLHSTTPVVASPTSADMVQDQSGAIVTGSIFANCELQVLSGSSIQACGITKIKNNGTISGSSDIQNGSSGNYNYKVTSIETATGADICYVNGTSATRDSNGNIICYDNDFFTSASGISCPSGGTYTNGRCQYTLNSICSTDGVGKSRTGGGTNTYNSTAQTCTSTQVNYALKLNSTALTLTAD